MEAKLPQGKNFIDVFSQSFCLKISQDNKTWQFSHLLMLSRPFGYDHFCSLHFIPKTKTPTGLKDFEYLNWKEKVTIDFEIYWVQW